MKWNLWLVAITFAGIVESLHNNDSHRILSRKKRWLIFPEGSSLQVVHFQGIPIYGVPLVFILGITGAIGYELPYYPLSDIAEELGERIKNGTLGLRHDQDISKVKYVDKPYNKYTKHKYYYTDPAANEIKIPKAPFKWNSNFLQPPFNTSFLTHLAKQPAVVDLKNLWSNIKEKLQDFRNKNSNSYPSFSNQMRPYSRPQTLSWRRNGMRHRNNHFKLLPILAKRSVEGHQFNGTSLKEKFMLEPSLSRHKLYSRIETYLETKGVNGRECVLKTLCQSKMSSKLPNTFISEIMKTVFSLPLDANLVDDFDFKQYHNAHHGVNGDCSLIYDKCEYNLWDNHFMNM